MTYDSIHPILEWIAAHPMWSGFVVFLISLSESLAIVGLVVPGVVMMTAIGAMMGNGILPFWATLLWAILGAIAGDGISYWLGYHYHEKLKEFWPFRQFPQLLARGETFFKNHGGKSIIFGRFVGPVRPMIPVIAGMMDMPPRRFLFFNIVSAIAWAPLYSLPGILIGASLGTLSPDVARKIVFLILLLLLALWLFYVLLLKLGLSIARIISHSINTLWNRVSASHQFRWLHYLLATGKNQGGEAGQLGILILFLLSTVVFIFITWNVWESTGLAKWNEPIYQLLRALYIEKLVNGTILFTSLGEPTIVTITAVCVGLFLVWRRRYFAAFCWIATICGGNAIGYIVRHLVEMPRPEGLAYVNTQYSYPSGHALSSTLLYGLAAAFIQPLLAPGHRSIPWLIAIPLIFLISLSRLYLGVHWFTDILGGVTLGIASISMGLLVLRRFEHQVPNIRSILVPGISVLSACIIYYGLAIYPIKQTELVRKWPIEEINTAEWWQGDSALTGMYRTGAFKKIATVFNVQWLGSIDTIQKQLNRLGFASAPTLTFNSSLRFLADNPTPDIMPVLPRFHRDRLPVLVMTKPIDRTDRLVMQLWQSDFIDEKGAPVFVGTLRRESAKHPIPFFTVFQETSSDENDDEAVIQSLRQELQKMHNLQFHDQTYENESVLLIQSA